MTAVQPVLTVVREIKAPPETVFSFFTEAERWLSWMGVDAELDPRPGGVFRMNVLGDGYASGHFVAVEPPSRISFTWGWKPKGARCHPHRAPSRSPSSRRRQVRRYDWRTMAFRLRCSVSTREGGSTSSSDWPSGQPVEIPGQTRWWSRQPNRVARCSSGAHLEMRPAAA
jgi:uncharacterized protein YndB with AHSA1/START domain